ncbi:replication protein [Acinetobacter johnsonii]|uniref:replication protein n=1 Tax=Acinetobacter johnsonii TaxID=40214 RepID=UPI00244C7623|nr:replication protein [Acinetobacter johnsonii]MDH1706203.1 replication protein [Acinetobacter johnsonii]
MSNFLSNAFMLPNDLVDKGYMALMKGPALACYLFIVRKTRGWNKSTDSISVSQLIEGTGYNKDSVLKGCEKLVELGIIVRKSFANQPAKYDLTDGIFAVDILDSEKNAVENIDGRANSAVESLEGGVDILDSTQSKISTHNNNYKTTNTKTNINNGEKTNSTSEKPKKQKKELFDAKPVELPENVNRDLWIQFVDMRAANKKSLTENAVKLILKKLESFGALANQSLENSIIGNYQGVFAPKQDHSANPQNNNAHRGPSEPGYFMQMFNEQTQSTAIDVTPDSTAVEIYHS